MNDARASSAQSKAERVYQDLRRRIRELTLPPGAPLRKEEIAAALNVSKAPVSEAIARLAAESLVDVFPQHGSFVAPIRVADVRESLFIRTALEVEAIRHLTTTVEASLLSRLGENLYAQEAALAQRDLAQFYDLDESLHAMIFAAIAGPRAQRLLDAARAPLDRPRRLTLPEEGRAEATLAEHRQIIDAIRSRDPELATAAMRTHLRHVSRAVENELVQIDATSGV
jgi:DNA-binding GntR family transcriptional regulator